MPVSYENVELKVNEVKTDLDLFNERPMELGTSTPQTTSDWKINIGGVNRRILHSELATSNQQGELSSIVTDLDENYYTITETSALITITADSINSSVEALTTAVNTDAARIDVNESNITTIQDDITTLEQTATSLSLSVSQTGGVNALQNSCGLKGNIREWQIYDDDAVLVDSRNNGTIDTGSDVRINTESGSGIALHNQYLTTTVRTTIGRTYTFYMRYFSDAASDLTITGVVGTINIPTSASWTTYKYQVVATATATTIRIENSSSENITVSDLVFKLGDTNGWIQAPNEVYGANFIFDKDGFSITSLTDPFKSTLDNTSLAVYDTSSGSDKVMMLVSKDSAKLTSGIVQDLLQIQRYDNTAKALRIIPTSTGAYIVINN